MGLIITFKPGTVCSFCNASIKNFKIQSNDWLLIDLQIVQNKSKIFSLNNQKLWKISNQKIFKSKWFVVDWWQVVQNLMKKKLLDKSWKISQNLIRRFVVD